MDHPARLWLTLLVGAALLAILLVPVPAGERALVAHGAGYVVLPYLALALASRVASAQGWAIVLVAFMAGTTVGILSMLADASGGVALEWIVPAQVLAATVLAAHGVARRRGGARGGARAPQVQ